MPIPPNKLPQLEVFRDILAETKREITFEFPDQELGNQLRAVMTELGYYARFDFSALSAALKEVYGAPDTLLMSYSSYKNFLKLTEKDETSASANPPTPIVYGK